MRNRWPALGLVACLASATLGCGDSSGDAPRAGSDGGASDVKVDIFDEGKGSEDASTADAFESDSSVSEASTEDASSTDSGGSAVDSAADVTDSSTDAQQQAKPVIIPPADQEVAEDALLKVVLSVEGATRVFVTGLPPGARFREAERTILFTPDFIQGDTQWKVQIVATNKAGESSSFFWIRIKNTIKPPWPSVMKEDTGAAYRSLTLKQSTDKYLDSSGYAGRSFDARVNVPLSASAQNKKPVRISLHGAGGSVNTSSNDSSQYVIYPHDPMNSYWWGYGEKLPGAEPSSGKVPNYTQRRVLHLLEWVLANHPGADPERVYVVGGSMGGAGAMALGTLYGRHFAYVDATIGQTVARNHRPSRIAQLKSLWGAALVSLLDGTSLEDGSEESVWDRLDITRLHQVHSEAQNQFVFTKHGKDDPTIHFGAVTIASPKTKTSFYDSLNQNRIGHYSVWDEGGHGTADPLLGANWWSGSFSFMTDSKTYLRRDRPFPAFTNASHNWNPGDGTGNGKVSWNAEKGYANDEKVSGDTGWKGDVAGVLNRFLRWDTGKIVDEQSKLELPLMIVSGSGSAPPSPGFPSKGDLIDRSFPITLDVTPRRVQNFVCLPGEAIVWTAGSQTGTAVADKNGAVTIQGVKLDKAGVTLILTRK